ncbi:unnamed protein product [Calypogeia fissa]
MRRSAVSSVQRITTKTSDFARRKRRSSSSCSSRSYSSTAITCSSSSWVRCPNLLGAETSKQQLQQQNQRQDQQLQELQQEEEEENKRRSRSFSWSSRRISSRSPSSAAAMSTSSDATTTAAAATPQPEEAAAAAADQKLGSTSVTANGTSNGPSNGGGEKKLSSSQQQNGAVGAGEEGEDHGFTRPEMHSVSLVGTVQYFERHLFLACKGPESWPSMVEAASDHFDRLPHRLAGALKSRKNDMPLKSRMTVCEESAGAAAGDVLMFPDMVRYKGLTDTDVDEFVEDVLVGGKEWKKTGSGPECLSGSFIFVCSHGSRDKRCGSCGPVLIETLNEEIRVRGLEGQIFVGGCSHVGGHKYAGNVIVFSSSGTGAPVSGHWYGYVSPADVPLILDQHIGRGEIIERLWRGQMGVSEGDAKEAQQSRLKRVEAEGSGTCCQRSAEQANGCGSGSGCCQSAPERVFKEVKENRIPDFLVSAGSTIHDGHLIFPEDEDTDEEITDPRIKLWGSYYIPLPKWVQNWEKEDTNAALAVVGAGAAVAIAVRLWREACSSS